MFYCIDSDEEIRDSGIYDFENEQEAREFFDCVEGARLVGFESVEMDEWITSHTKPEPEELADWIAPLKLDQVHVSLPGSHPGHGYWITPSVEVFYPVFEEKSL